MMDNSKEFQRLVAAFGTLCPPDLLNDLKVRLTPWDQPFPECCYHQYKSFPAMVDAERMEAELEVALLLPQALFIVRVATDGVSEITVPYRNIQRLRFVEKEGKQAADIYHGDCITWLERSIEARLAGDLRHFVTQLQRRLMN